MKPAAQRFKVAQVKTYTHEVLGEFILQEEWNGLSKLCRMEGKTTDQRREDGSYLIIIGSPAGGINDLLLSPAGHDEFLNVVAGSSNLIQKLQEIQEEKDAKDAKKELRENLEKVRRDREDQERRNLQNEAQKIVDRGNQTDNPESSDK